MLAVALFFDGVLALIQLIPIAGSVAASVFTVIPFMLFFIWYKLQGVNFAKPSKSITFLGGSLIEFIPALNALPGWTAEVVVMYILQKKDVILAKAAGAVGGVAGASAVAGTVAKTVGAKEVGKNLKETSGKLRETEKNIRSNIGPLQNVNSNTVGNEISKPKDQKKNEPDNVIPFKKESDEGFTKPTPYSNAKPSQPHNKDWIFPNDKAA